MAYSSLNFAAYEDLTKDIDRDYEVDDQTLRAMIRAENSDFFDALSRIITRYAAERKENELITFFAMLQDGCNDVIELLAGDRK